VIASFLIYKRNEKSSRWGVLTLFIEHAIAS